MLRQKGNMLHTQMFAIWTGLKGGSAKSCLMSTLHFTFMTRYGYLEEDVMVEA